MLSERLKDTVATDQVSNFRAVGQDAKAANFYRRCLYCEYGHAGFSHPCTRANAGPVQHANSPVLLALLALVHSSHPDICVECNGMQWPTVEAGIIEGLDQGAPSQLLSPRQAGEGVGWTDGEQEQVAPGMQV